MPHLELPSFRHQYSRRNWLLRFAAAPLSAVALRDARADTSAKPLIAETAEERFIAMAFEMKSRATADGDQPYGAVVVKDRRIVGEAPSRVVTGRDPTAHAEMEAIRDAARRLGTRDLGGCTMYSSSRPCPMCEAAAYWAGISGLVHGSDGTESGAPRLRRC